MREKYESLPLAELKAVAKARGLKGLSAMKKDDVVEAMLQEDERERKEKEAKAYYKIEAEDVSYKSESEKNVSEVEIQNILLHFKKISKNPEKFANSFDKIASQYTEEQLKIIVNCLPNNVKVVLEDDCKK